MPKKSWVNVILPLALPGTFTYHFDVNLFQNLGIGQRIIVPFGNSKLYTGIISSFSNNPPERYKTKAIVSVLDDEELIDEKSLKLWHWIASYYMCTVGEVLRMALPSSFLLESETYIFLDEDYDSKINVELSENNHVIIEALKHKNPLNIKELNSMFTRFPIMKTVHELLGYGLVRIQENIKNKYKPKSVVYIELNSEIISNEKLFNKNIQELKPSPKQKEALFQLIQIQTQNNKPINKTSFQKQYGFSSQVLKELESKSWIYLVNQEESRLRKNTVSEELSKLSPTQNETLNQLQQKLPLNKPVLFHGVAASGKTEIALHLIQEQLQQNKQVLFIVPNISIGVQMALRWREIFGEDFGLYNTKLNANEKVEFYNKVRSNEIKIILCSKSGLFLPFRDLGLVIVDDENDTSHKSGITNPKLSSRDTGVYLSKLYTGKCLLISSTPSLESLKNVRVGKYNEVKINERYFATPPPKIQLIDLRKAHKQKAMHQNISHGLKEAIDIQLQQGKQVILYLNRRGYAPVMECKTCGHIPYCPSCDVPLTYHKKLKKLVCHYCGYQDEQTHRCLSCGSTDISHLGIGTEQLELEVKELYPEAEIARMDVDSMRRKYAYEQLITKFENQEIDILIGTQMLSKGLDFNNVGLVGVIRAENAWSFPDYRSHESAFQSLHQLSERAGRRKSQGLTLVQSFTPEHSILNHLQENSYYNFAETLLKDRKDFLYPPFVKIIGIEWKHKNEERVIKTAEQYIQLIKNYIPEKAVLGPEAPPVARIKNQYIRKAMVKIPADMSPSKVKTILQNEWNRMQSIGAFKSVKISFDVDA